LGAWLCFEDEAGQGLRPPKGRTPVVRVTAAGTKHVSMAALICTKAGDRSRLSG
jgi:putative transposase